uniref:Uncharacterized protein n=1 Tax=Arundo donax TaxID=35708 RepID=A0A0A9CI15_ARUDO
MHFHRNLLFTLLVHDRPLDEVLRRGRRGSRGTMRPIPGHHS